MLLGDVMPPLRYSSNVTRVACCDRRTIPTHEVLHGRALASLAHADGLLFACGAYEKVDAPWREAARTALRSGWIPQP